MRSDSMILYPTLLQPFTRYFRERGRERERRKVGVSFLKRGVAVLDKLLINGVMGHEVEAGGTVEAWKVHERQ